MSGKWRRWTEAEDASLIELRMRGDNWDDIGQELRRASGSCQQRFNKRKPEGTPRKPIKRRMEVFPKAPPAPSVIPIAQALPSPPSGRRVSTHVLIADAELRARIELQGLTAGLLGDPMPGRSALDEKRRGGA